MSKRYRIPEVHPIRKITFIEETRAAFVADWLQEHYVDFSTTYDGRNTVHTNAPKVLVQKVPAGFINPWES